MEISIRRIKFVAQAPMDLLLLADPSTEMIGEYLPTGQCYVARNLGEDVGVIVLLKTRPKTIEIMNIAVKEAYQGQGIGKQLLAFAIQQARKMQMRTIEIGTGNPGMQQLLLYQKCGFRIVGVDFDFFRRHYPERIYENGIECRDMIRLQIDLTEQA
jgi:ribosomal protein S18 acetylase RimI-like enzyme